FLTDVERLGRSYAEAPSTWPVATGAAGAGECRAGGLVVVACAAASVDRGGGRAELAPPGPGHPTAGARPVSLGHGLLALVVCPPGLAFSLDDDVSRARQLLSPGSGQL